MQLKRICRSVFLLLSVGMLFFLMCFSGKLTNQEKETKEIVNELSREISNAVWYEGNESEFYDFLNTKCKVDVYFDNRDPSYFLIAFDKKKLLWGTDVSGFFAINSYKDWGGFKQEPYGYFLLQTKKELDDNIKSDSTLKWVYLGSEEFALTQPKKPTYTPMSSLKRKLIEEVKEWGETDLWLWGLPAGRYTIYVKNFNITDGEINFVVENKTGGVWLYSVDVFENGDVDGGKPIDANRFQAYRNRAAQYRKEAIEKTSIMVKQPEYAK